MADLQPLGVRFVAENFGQFTGGIAGFKQQIDGVNSSLRRIGRSAGGMSKGINLIGNATDSAVPGISTMSGALNSLGNKMQIIGGIATGLGFRLGLVFTLPFVSGSVAVSKAAANFETEMTKINTLVGLSATEVQQLSSNILKMASDLGALPTDLAEAAFFVTSGGIRDVSAALDVLAVSSKASAIGLGEISEVANAVTSVMIAYSNENMSAARATDVLAATVQRGKFEIDSLGSSIGKVLGLASAMGVSFEQAGAVISTFTLSGSTASQAVTGLQRILTSIIKPSNQAVNELERLGFTIDRTGNEAADFIRDNGLVQFLVEVRDRADAGDVALEKIFSRVTALGTALFITGEQSDLLMENLVAIQESSGLVDRGFEEVAATSTFQWNQLQSTLQSTAIIIGDAILPLINQLTQDIAPLIISMAEFARLNPDIAQTLFLIGALLAALGPLLIIFGTIASSIGTLISALGALAGAIAFLTSPVGVVIAALGTLVALFIGSFNKIDSSANDAVGKLKNNLDSNMDAISNDALGWGRNVVIQLARGMAQAAAAVVRVLIQIGNIVSDWLSPGSPPKLLPDLREWGQNVIDQFMIGWTEGNFDIFNDVAGIMEGYIRSLGDDVIPEDGVIPAIMGSRAAIAEAINQLRTVGDISEDIIGQISGGYGGAASDIEEYIRILADLEQATQAVSEAQDEVNRIQEEYAEALDPINQALDEIDARQQRMAEEDRIAELNQIIAENIGRGDPASIEAVERARLELQEINLQQRKRAIEEARDTELEAAEAALEAAEAEQQRLENALAAQRALIDAQIRNNELLQEQAGILERLAEAMEDVGSGLGGGLGGGIGGIGGEGDIIQPGDPLGVPPIDAEDIPGFSNIIGQGLLENAESILPEIEELINDIEKEFEPLTEDGGLLDQLTDVWGEVFSEILSDENIDAVKKFGENWGDVAKRLFVGYVAITFISNTLSIFAPLVSILTTLLSGLAGVLKLVSIPALKLAAIISGPVGIAFIAAVTAVSLLIRKFGSLEGAWKAVKDTFSGTGTFGRDGIFVVLLRETWEAIKDFFSSDNFYQLGDASSESLVNGLFNKLIKFNSIILPEWYQDFVSFIVGKQLNILSLGIKFSRWLIDGLKSIYKFISVNLPIWWVRIQLFFLGIALDVAKLGENFYEWLAEGLSNINKFFTETLPEWWESVKTWWNGISDGVKEAGEDFSDWLLDGLKSIDMFFTETLPQWFSNVRQWFSDKQDEWSQIGENIIQGIIDGLFNAASSLYDAISGIISDAIAAAIASIGGGGGGDSDGSGDGSDGGGGSGDGGGSEPYNFGNFNFGESFEPVTVGHSESAPVTQQRTSNQEVNINTGPIQNGIDSALLIDMIEQAVAGSI